MISPFLQVIALVLWTPVAQLVALWGMTSKATLQLMKSSGQESAMSLRLIMSSKQENARAVQ
jgi:hypothetical protein